MQLLDLFHRARALKAEPGLAPALLEMEGGQISLFLSRLKTSNVILKLWQKASS